MKKILIWASALVISLVAQSQLKGQGVQVSSLAKHEKVVLDLSHHNGDVDFAAVAAAGVKAVFLKATEGTSTDRCLKSYYDSAKSVGLKVGVYHFLSMKSSAKSQVAHFLETIRDLDLDLIAVIDIEIGGDTPGLVDTVNFVLNAVELSIGCKPIIYTNEAFFNRHLGQAFKEYPLFIAKYSSHSPDVVAGDIYLWQVTDKALLADHSGFFNASILINGHRLCDLKLPMKRKGKKANKSNY